MMNYESYGCIVRPISTRKRSTALIRRYSYYARWGKEQYLGSHVFTEGKNSRGEESRVSNSDVFFFNMPQQPIVGRDLLIIEAAR
jgi:hypothetical protein